MYNNELVQNLERPRWSGQRIKNQAIKISAERRKNPPSTINKTKNNILDVNFKQKQMQSQYKKLFKDIETYKELNQDEKSHTALENIENKLDLLIKGILELLQEIKPKYSLINETHEIKVPGQYLEESICCQDCIGNDSALKLAMKEEIIKQENPKQTVHKRELIEEFCKNSHWSTENNINEAEDDKPHDECNRYCKYLFNRSDTLKTCKYKLEEAFCDKHKLDNGERGKEYDKYSINDNSLIVEYDPLGQHNDLTTDTKNQASTSYYIKSKEQARTNAIVKENENNTKQLRGNMRNEDNYGRDGVAQDEECGISRMQDNTQNGMCSRCNNKQLVDEIYEKRKIYNYAQNEESGMKKGNWCTETCNKFQKNESLSQRCDEMCPKLKTKYNESCCFGAASTSRYDKKTLQEQNAYSEENPLYLDTASVRPKSSVERKLEHLLKTQNYISSCRRPKSEEPRQDSKNTSEENQPSLERGRFPIQETERDNFRDMCKGIRRKEPDKQIQNSNDEKPSRFNRQTPKFDTYRQSRSLQKKAQPPTITGSSCACSLNVETSRVFQDYIKQTRRYETETSQRHELKNDASDDRTNNESEKKNNEKDVRMVLEINEGSNTKFDPKIKKDTEQDQDLENRLSYIDHSTSVNRVANVSRGSSPDRSNENRYGFKINDQHTCVVAKNYGSPFCNNHRYENSKMDKIIIEEINKSDQAKKEIESILNGEFSKACAASFSFDMPTKEKETEVSSSLYSYNSATRTINTVAVNTDPMGFLALLRISTDTIRSLLGQMNLDRFYSPLAYITQLSLPLSSLATMQSDIPGFICNICDSVFPSRSQLSLHNVDHRNEIYRFVTLWIVYTTFGFSDKMLIST